jgi:hypothetical protein
MKRILFYWLFLIVLFLFGCVPQNLNNQAKFLSASPRSILIVPVVNKTVDVTATDYMLSTITIPLAERGYYVFPINAVKRVLEDDGLADSSLVHSSSASKLASLFGADAVLYIVIERWDAQYMLLSTTVTVALNYQIRDGKTDDVLWENRAEMVYQPQQSNSGNPLVDLVAMAITAAVTKAAPNYMPLAHQANAKALLNYPGSGIPFGPYAPTENLNMGNRGNDARLVQPKPVTYISNVDFLQYSQKLVKGKTTKQDVEKDLGKTTEQSYIGDYEYWAYYYKKPLPNNDSPVPHRLTLKYDNNGILYDYVNVVVK